MSVPLLRFENVGKCFRIYQVQKTLFRLGKSIATGIPFKRDLWALRNVSFEIFEGDRVAIIGSNGAGKTTLFRIASGIYLPTEGKIDRKCPLRPLFVYGIGAQLHLPVLDNIYIVGSFYGLTVREIRQKLDAILEFSELQDFLYVPVKNLSVGQMTRLGFSVFIQTQDPFIALDESFSLADLRFQEKSQKYFDSLMNSGKTVLLTSHNNRVIRRFCQRAIWLEKGEIRQAGPAEEVVSAYERFCGVSATAK